VTRTTRDIFIDDISVSEAKDAIIEWFKENKIKVLVNTPDYVYGRLGSGIFTVFKFFEVTFVPAQNGVIAKTEGWIAYVPPEILNNMFAVTSFVPETEFAELESRPLGRSQKQGMETIKRLWAMLEALSKNKGS
jgi:hypothetical protein